MSEFEKVPREAVTDAVRDIVFECHDSEVLEIAAGLQDKVHGVGPLGSVELLMRLGWWMQEAGL